MPTAPGTPADQNEPVGTALARMRHARRLTGAQLASRVGMSQPKISRIERGRGAPDPEDIHAIARALGASEAEARVLMERAARAHDRIADWRPTSVNLAGRQETMADWESAAAEVRDFEPALLPGLLQTSEYAAAALRAFQVLLHPDAEQGVESAIEAAVAARIGRRKVLLDPAKSFEFVLTEAVLRNRICPPANMLSQIDRLRRIADRENVTIGIIPEEVEIAIPPLHGFTLFDDDLVVIDIYNTGLTARGRTDVAHYRHVFDQFRQQAIADIGPVLDRYETVYLELYRAR